VDATLLDLLAGDGRGPLAGEASDDLNVTVLAWPAGGGPPAHVNHERDVVFVVAAGDGMLSVDGCEHALRQGLAVLIPKGARRALTAGPEGIRYLAVHLRRGGLQIARSRARDEGDASVAPTDGS